MTAPELVLLTGASGRIGTRLLKAMQASGIRVRALIHERPARLADESVTGSITNPEGLRDAAEGASAILHLAAVTHARSGADYERTNVDGTRNLVRAASESGDPHFVLISSRAVDRRGGPYSQSKFEAEEIVRSSGLRYTIIRLPELYGVRGREGLDRIVGSAQGGRPILIAGRGDELVCPMHVDDAVAACMGGLRRDPVQGKTYTLAGPCLSLRAFAERARETYGTTSALVRVPLTALMAASQAAK